MNASELSRKFISSVLSSCNSYESANIMIENACGIVGFFGSDSELGSVCHSSDGYDRTEYGDYQTGDNLAERVVSLVIESGFEPSVVFEPTCGRGDFIIAALDAFPNVDEVFGVEIQDGYVWQAKFRILDYFLNRPERKKPRIHILRSSIFGFDFSPIRESAAGGRLLIIGNPPWVTNTELCSIGSDNVPAKSNEKGVRGIEAMTGKGNFDIAEYITTDLLANFCDCDGRMAFLVKGSVIRAVVRDLKRSGLRVSDMRKYDFDAKSEFGISADASLFLCRLNNGCELSCREFDLYTLKEKRTFGYRDGRFVSDLSFGKSRVDGVCPYEWRQGMKHDCSKVMEFVRDGDMYRNKLGERFALERDMVYPLLKSSDLKHDVARDTDRRTIVTQRYVGQDTSYITDYPNTFRYLNDHIGMFRGRKSKIYRNKCDFSIFGIGDYAFKPYKVAISGLYKTYHFCLVKSQDCKPVMLDDTCYYIGFDTLEEAVRAWKMLNSDCVADFLKSITFKDSKRMITKDVLMRVDFENV